MMRIAIAGGGGLGFMLATALSQAHNAYNVVVLSRSVRHEFASYDIQVHVVDYTNKERLQFALQGIDLVISTISGQSQLALIDAAGQKQVRYFVPSEFEGSLAQRPAFHHDKLNRGSSEALELLIHWSEVSRMKFTVFSCGIFMERFHPFGLSSLGAGVGTRVSRVGDYLLNINAGTAEFTDRDAKGRIAHICLTSVFDVVRFIIAAVDLGPSEWPREYTMYGDRLSLADVVSACSAARKGTVNTYHYAYHDPRRRRSTSTSSTNSGPLSAPFESRVVPYEQLSTYINFHSSNRDWEKVAYYQRLQATADGRYEFSKSTLIEAIGKSDAVNVRPLKFAEWLASTITT